MKKEYMQPQMEVVFINANQQLLAGSVDTLNNNLDLDLGDGGSGPVLGPSYDNDLFGTNPFLE